MAMFGVLAGCGPAESPHAFAGAPRSQDWHPAAWQHVLAYEGFTLGYSEWRQAPLWVAFRLGGQVPRRVGPRPRRFTVERRTLVRVDAAAMRGSGYDRGHLAPNYAIARYWGRQAQIETFRMTNIVAQRKRLNQKLWQRLEELEVDVYAADEPLWVVTGPVFDAEVERLDSGVEVPDAFFRVWLSGPVDAPRVLAFIVPQEVSGYEPLDAFVTSVDAVEAATGLDLFHALDDALEEPLEARVDPGAWLLHRYANRPPRY